MTNLCGGFDLASEVGAAQPIAGAYDLVFKATG